MKFSKTLTVAIILLVIITPKATCSQDSDNLLSEALSEVGANPEMLDIVDWSVINREFMDFTQMQQYQDEIMKIFNAEKENFDSTKENNETYRILNIEGKLDSDTFLQIIIQSAILPAEYEKDPQTYLTISVSSRNLEKYNDFAKKVSKTINSLGGQSKITSCVTGTFNGKLDEAQQDKLVETIASYFEIINTEKIQDKYNFSIIGFSPLLSEGIQILGKNYNIHIAIRYNSDEDTTYIWIGTPVISLEY